MAQSNTAVTLPDLFKRYTGHHPPKPDAAVQVDLKKTTIHHERCRAIAEFLWSLEPELTIREMASRVEITQFGCEGHQYDVRTVCRWLSDLKGHRRPGRPRKRAGDEL